MKHVIKYYGMIEEVTRKHKEEISFEKPMTVSEFIAHAENLYPALKHASYRVAVNKTLMDLDFVISTDSEIALLPPFAGG